MCTLKEVKIEINCLKKTALNQQIKFAIFHSCSLEDSVCSEMEDEETIEHYRLSQYDRTLQAVTI